MGGLLTVRELYPTYLYKEHNVRVLAQGLISIMNRKEAYITCLLIDRNYYYLHSRGVASNKMNVFI